MNWIIFCLGIAQCMLIWALGRAGKALRERARKEREMARYTPPGGWPDCAMIIPVAGVGPNTEKALRSLLEQVYEPYKAYIVMESPQDGAAPLAARLELEYPRLTTVYAGQAEKCAQKNYNLLAGVAAAGPEPEVLVFCDSSHVAREDFLRCLVNPLAHGEAAFTTGYHEVEARDNVIGTLGYAICALFMRLLQGISLLTQPWGGALAMTRTAFSRYKVADLWARNVVDDCSLAALLRREGVHTRLCASALLKTYAAAHPFRTWSAWLTRQILFLKFCIPSQWLALGLASLWMIIPPIWCVICVIRGLFDIGNGSGPFLALTWLCLVSLGVMGWRGFLPRKAMSGHWLLAFFAACAMFFIVYTGTLFTRRLTWQHIEYEVGPDGEVQNLRRGPAALTERVKNS